MLPQQFSHCWQARLWLRSLTSHIFEISGTCEQTQDHLDNHRTRKVDEFPPCNDKNGLAWRFFEFVHIWVHGVLSFPKTFSIPRNETKMWAVCFMATEAFTSNGKVEHCCLYLICWFVLNLDYTLCFRACVHWKHFFLCWSSVLLFPSLLETVQLLWKHCTCLCHVFISEQSKSKMGGTEQKLNSHVFEGTINCLREDANATTLFRSLLFLFLFCFVIS